MAREAEQLAEQADRIKKLRALARKTGETVASELGVSYRTYQRWEGGAGEISIDNLKRLAAYFGTTADFIEYGAIERGETPDPFSGSSGGTLTEILEMLRRLDQQLIDAETERSNALAAQLERFAVVLQRLDRIDDAMREIAPRRRRTA